MSNPYSETINNVIETIDTYSHFDVEAVIKTLRDLDDKISQAFESMHELHSEVLRLEDENELLKREGVDE